MKTRHITLLKLKKNMTKAIKFKNTIEDSHRILHDVIDFRRMPNSI